MEELLDMISSDESPAQISDKIKDILFAKSAERIDAYRPEVSSQLFGNEDIEVEVEDEIGGEEGE